MNLPYYKKIKIAIGHFIRICATSFFIFVLMDFFLSLFFKQFLVERFGESAIVRTTSYNYDHDLKRNLDLNVSWGSRFRYRLCTNEFGFKDFCENVGKTLERHFDVAFIGDSVTEGVGLPFEETFAGLYARNNPKLRVANLGVVSYSPSIYFSKIRYLLNNGFTFKKVVILPDISDIQDEGLNYVLVDGLVLRRDSDLASHGSFTFNHLKNQLKSYFILSFNIQSLFNVGREVAPLEHAFKSTMKVEDEASLMSIYAKSEIHRSEWPYNRNSAHYGIGGVDVAIQQAVDSMEMLADLLNERGIKFDLVTYPWPTLLARGHATSGSSIWREFCKRKGCEYFLDVGEELAVESALSGKLDVINRYFFYEDIHFNANGNALVYRLYDRVARGH